MIMSIYLEVMLHYFSIFLFIQSRLQDHVMILGVVCLVLIDLAILGIYTLVEGVRSNLDVKRIPNREFSQETIGVSHTVNYSVLVHDTLLIELRKRDI